MALIMNQKKVPKAKQEQQHQKFKAELDEIEQLLNQNEEKEEEKDQINDPQELADKEVEQFEFEEEMNKE